MLEQQAQGNVSGKSPHRTRSKFHIGKAVKSKALHSNLQGQAFNDPLYEYLDHEVHNKEQHNFGPWVEHERLKSRERNQRIQRELPVLYRPQDTTTRYYQEQQEQLTSENSQNAQNAGSSLPNIKQRTLRSYSLQNLRAASLQFNPANNMPQIRRQTSLKTPFFLRMHGYPFPKGQDLLQNTKKCNVIYNYCYQEDPAKDILLNKGLLAKKNENYFKLAEKKTSLLGQSSTNQMLLRELKQHRMNKLK